MATVEEIQEAMLETLERYRDGLHTSCRQLLQQLLQEEICKQKELMGVKK